MKQMLLASSGPSSSKNIKKIFLRLACKTPEKIKVLAMICPRNKIREITYPKWIREDLRKLGIFPKNITFVNINKNVSAENFKELEFDVFLSWGGNTFLILDRVRKTGFDKFIKRIVNKGKFYFGSSAGSIIVFKTIEIAGFGSEGDENPIKLKNLKGLNLFDTAIFPHYHKELRKEVLEFKKKVKYKVQELRNGEAILVLGKRKKLIKI
jgi:dipeptidase E